jgi:hypothetical protein
MSRRRLRRKDAKIRRQAPPPAESETRVVVREARRVERLAYTRTQAAQALGVGRSTFIRRVLPHVETIEMPWGAKLIPVDELERLLREQRRKVSAEERRGARPGRKTNVPAEIAALIRAERATGKSLAAIAQHLSRRASQPRRARVNGGRRRFAPSWPAPSGSTPLKAAQVARPTPP